MKESERQIQAVSAALEVLMAFNRDVPLRLKDLYERTGHNRSRLLRLLGTLESHGFIQANPAEGTYELGRTLYRLGNLLHDRFARVDAIIRPVLQRLVSETGDTAFFSTIDGLRRVVVTAEESPELLRFAAREGQERPLHVGASSKVLLTFADADIQARALSLVPETEKPSLVSELEQIRERGFAVSRGEATAHGFAIAVPVRRLESNRTDVLSLAGVLSKLNPQLVESHVARLVREATHLETALSQPR